MKKLLYISYFAPYDRVDHAGGKVHNFYIKKIQKEEAYDVTLLTMCYIQEVEKLDLEQYGIRHELVVLDHSKFQRYLRMFVSGFSYFNPWDAYSGILLNYERYRLKKMISGYAGKNEKPDLIILQWTQIILLMPFIRKLYPDVPIVAIEEDVLFLNYQRRISLAKTTYAKKIAEFQYRNVKKKELEALKTAQLTVTNNSKDGRLLIENDIDREKVFVSSIYFENYNFVQRQCENRDILFYGAMYRDENHMSAIWFIEKVLPLLPEWFQFVVVGTRPRKELLAMQSDRVKVLGFVEDISPYFQTCICLAAPLRLGAGIKVKILEAMSAGVPVLTNDIGIEGIEAAPGKEYLHCNTEREYADAICRLYHNQEEAAGIGMQGREYVKDRFDLEQKYQELLEIIANELL